MSLLDELKRRKVLKVGAAYLVVAWLAVQAASIGFPAFDAPPWALRIFILVVLLGFPIALVLTWVIDLTPDGLKIDSGTAGRKRVFAAAAVLIVLALGWYFHGQPSFRKGDAATPAVADRNSIAVLPFANMSGKPDQDYFADGMTEELLNVLAKLPQLQVVARTSVFQFKGQGGDVREIGRKLGVSHIVEGSVRRDGEQVRVTAQLIRVADGIHLWSETYDRELKGVFALQDDIARRIASELKLSLGADLPVAERAEIAPAAYDEYLKGRVLHRQRKDMPAAIAHLRAAVELEPDFGAAWAALSLAYEVVPMFATPEELRRLGDVVALEKSAAARAAALQPDAATSEHALANDARANFRYAQAERHYLRAMQIDPGYPDVLEDYSELLAMVGRTEEAASAARKLVTLEPYTAVFWGKVYVTAKQLGRQAEVEEAVVRWREIGSEMRAALGMYYYLLQRGHLDEAQAELALLRQRTPEFGENDQVLLRWARREPGADDAKARRLIAEDADYLDYAAARGDPDLYFTTVAAARRDMYQKYLFIHISRPVGQPMLADPRAKKALAEYGFVAYWREKGWPALCRPLGSDDFECRPNGGSD